MSQFSSVSRHGFAWPLPSPPSAASLKSILLRYKFHPGETIRWEVEHRTNVRTTVSRDT